MQIKGSSKEIADFVLQLQSQQKVDDSLSVKKEISNAFATMTNNILSKVVDIAKECDFGNKVD